MADKYITETSEDYAILDKHTGEILKYQQTIKVTREGFILLFFYSIPELAKLTGQRLKVLMVCWMRASYGDPGKESEVINDSDFKEEVRVYEPKMSDANIDACFSEFVKKNILRRICRGRYALNHNYFFRGKLSDRSRLAFKVEVDPKTAKKVKGRPSYSFFTKSIEIVELNEDGSEKE